MNIFKIIVSVFTGKDARFHSIFAPAIFLIDIIFLVTMVNVTSDKDYFPYVISNFATDETIGNIFLALLLLPFLSNIFVYIHRHKLIASHHYRKNLNNLLVCVAIVTLFLAPCTFIFPVAYNVYAHYVCAFSFFLMTNIYLYFNAFFARYCSKNNHLQMTGYKRIFLYRTVTAIWATISLLYQIADPNISFINWHRMNSAWAKTFNEKDLTIKLSKTPGSVDVKNIPEFGRKLSDHMFMVDFCQKDGWGKPIIKPVENLKLHPCTSGLHYGLQVFEGLKAYQSVHGNVHLFRPMDHIERFLDSAKRMCLPTFNEEEFLKCLIRLIEIDQKWCPSGYGNSLYIRPFLFSTEDTLGIKVPTKAKLVIVTSPVGGYFKNANKGGISLYADTTWIRSWPGGMGNIKAGGNYGPTLVMQKQATLNYGCDQILWMFNNEINECGTMNIFIYLQNKEGKMELVTPPLDGLILPGITRDSILRLVRQWNKVIVSERVITFDELCESHNDSRLFEIFGAGTACCVSPVERIVHKDSTIHLSPQKDSLTMHIKKELFDIYYGATTSDWTYIKIPSKE